MQDALLRLNHEPSSTVEIMVECLCTADIEALIVDRYVIEAELVASTLIVRLDDV